MVRRPHAEAEQVPRVYIWRQGEQKRKGTQAGPHRRGVSSRSCERACEAGKKQEGFQEGRKIKEQVVDSVEVKLTKTH